LKATIESESLFLWSAEGAAQYRGSSEHNIPIGTCSNVPLTLAVCFLKTLGSTGIPVQPAQRALFNV